MKDDELFQHQAVSYFSYPQSAKLLGSSDN